MFYLNGVPILTPEMDVVLKIKETINAEGNDLFKDIHQGMKNINITCPFHKDGQERRPSCGITIEHPQNRASGLVHCFTCGYRANLETFVSNVFGHHDFGSFGRKWLAKNFIQVSVEERVDIELDFSRKPKEKIQEFISEDELDRYRYTHPYMYQRKMTDEIIEQFDVGYDVNTDCLTFPVRDENGKTLFLARRAVQGKFFNYPDTSQKPLYGIYELPAVYDDLLICEGVIDALTAIRYGRLAIALLGLGSDYQFKQMKKLKCRKLICAFDGDKAGEQAAIKIKEQFSDKFIITYLELPEGRDINDLSKEEFISLPEYF